MVKQFEEMSSSKGGISKKTSYLHENPIDGLQQLVVRPKCGGPIGEQIETKQKIVKPMGEDYFARTGEQQKKKKTSSHDSGGVQLWESF